MSGPAPDPHDADLASLFAAERRRPGPPDAARARVLARVSASLGPGAAPSTGSAPAPALPPAGVALLGKPILLGMLLGGALVGAVAAYDGGAVHDAPRSIATVPEPTPRPVAAPLPRVQPLPSAPAESVPPRASSEAKAPARHEESLAPERAILDEANQALASGRSAAAFAALSRHAEEFPRGRLSEERDGLWIRALLAAGRDDEARARAARFKQLYPRSMLVPALESTLGTIP